MVSLSLVLAISASLTALSTGNAERVCGKIAFTLMFGFLLVALIYAAAFTISNAPSAARHWRLRVPCAVKSRVDPA